MIEPGPDDADTTIVRIGGDVDWIARYLVGLPFRCEVLEPDAVRAEIRRVARQLLREHPPAGHDAVGERGEEVHAVAVGIADGGVALAPERVPRLEMACVAGGDELGEDGVDVARAVAGEREGRPGSRPSAASSRDRTSAPSRSCRTSAGSRSAAARPTCG